MTSPVTSPQHPALLSFQTAFVDSFLRPHSAPHHLLIAPPGSGKTTVAALILKILRRSGQIKRGLVLCPPQFVTGYLSALADDDLPDAPAEVVDRYRFREWEAAAQSGESPFPNSIIAVMSIHLAGQPDVAASLAATQWDVLVVDEAQALVGQRATLVRGLLATGAVKRTLLTTATFLSESLSNDFSTTDWTNEVRSALSTATPAMRLNRVPVTYTDSETGVWKKLNELTAALVHDRHVDLARILVRRGQSSLFALEQSLLTLRDRVMNGDAITIVNQGVAEEPDVSKGDIASPGVWDRLSRTLTALAGVDSDSKLESLLNVLASQSSPKEVKAIAIFSRFADTVEYLTSTLADRGFTVRSVTGSTTASDRIAAIEAPAAKCITVFTLAAAEGCAFGSAQTYIFYERLEGQELSLCVLRMVAAKRDGPFDVISFEDKGAISSVGVVDKLEA